jgi:hypothetical protein
MAAAFDKELAHALVTRAIDQLKMSGIVIVRDQSDWMYRMGMVGVMAAYTARSEPVPRAVIVAISKGTPLSKKRWQDILKGEDA